MTVQQMGLANWFESGKRTTGHGFQFAISVRKPAQKRSRLTVACEKPVASSFWLLTRRLVSAECARDFAEHWRLIPDGEREQFAGVCGLCVYENGRVVGDRFPGAIGLTPIPWKFGIAIESGERSGDLLEQTYFAMCGFPSIS